MLLETSMPLVNQHNKHVYRCFKSCSFRPYFDPETLDPGEDMCVCQPYFVSAVTPPASSLSKRSSREKSGRKSCKSKERRVPAVAKVLDWGFSEWAPEANIDDPTTNKQNGRTGSKGASRKKSERCGSHNANQSEFFRSSSKDRPSFTFHEDIGSYMAEYRTKHIQRLVGFNGSSDPEDLILGENLPDPYVFKTTPFKKAFEAIHGYLLERKQPVLTVQKGQTQSNQNGVVLNAERKWRPSEIKQLPGLTAQPMFSTSLDSVCDSMRYVGQDVFKRSPATVKRNLFAAKTRILLSTRQNDVNDIGCAGDTRLRTSPVGLGTAVTNSPPTMKEQLSVSPNDESTFPADKSARESSPTSSSRNQRTPPTIKSGAKNDFMAIPVDSTEAARTMLVFLQKARRDVDKAREIRKKQLQHETKLSRTFCQGPSSASTREGCPGDSRQKVNFTAMLRSSRLDTPPCESHEEPTAGSAGSGSGSVVQSRNGRVKKVFRAGGAGNIKLEKAVKASKQNMELCTGT